MSKEIWYQEKGFFSNPFSIKPGAFDNELFGNASSISRIIKKVGDSEIVFVSGEFGVGKTAVMKRIIEEFHGAGFGAKKIIYYNCNRSEASIDYDKLLVGAGGFFGRLFGIRKKGMILLLDEMQDMNKKDLNRVKLYHDKGFFSSVVFVSRDDKVELPKELANEIGENKFVLENMKESEAVKMIRQRIGDLKFFSDDVILKIFRKDRNSRNFLKNCEDVARVAFEDGADEVSVEHIGLALGASR